MEDTLLAIAEISFPGGSVPVEDGNLIESLLRTDKNINNLSINSDKMIFFIWGGAKIDYGALDKIKNALSQKKGADFIISAVEYSRSGEKYRYDSKKPS